MTHRGTRRRTQGVTLVELMLYMGIASWMGLVVAKYLKIPAQLGGLMTAVTGEDAGFLATSIPADDLKSAIAVSLQWPLIDPTLANSHYDPAVNSQFMPWFQVHDPTIAAPELPISYICYAYRETDHTLVRRFISGGPPVVSSITACSPEADDFAQEKIIVKNLLPPTPDAPLFSKDSSAVNMVILTLRFKGQAGKVTKIVRRVHIRT